MIVREVLQNHGLALKLDLFNDAKDTITWLLGIPKEDPDYQVAQALAPLIQADYDNFKANMRRRNSTGFKG